MISGCLLTYLFMADRELIGPLGICHLIKCDEKLMCVECTSFGRGLTVDCGGAAERVPLTALSSGSQLLSTLPLCYSTTVRSRYVPQNSPAEFITVMSGSYITESLR